MRLCRASVCRALRRGGQPFDRESSSPRPDAREARGAALKKCVARAEKAVKMEKFIVQGDTRLCGEVTISGAKNAAVAIIPATILAQGKCVIENIPNISDITMLFKILRALGASVRMLDRTTVEVDTTYITEPVVPYELARYMRASYYLLGTLLSRCNRASVSMPGGCNFGVRRSTST